MNKSTLSALVVALMLGSGIAGYLIGKPGDTLDRPPPARTATTAPAPQPSAPAPAPQQTRPAATPAALPAAAANEAFAYRRSGIVKSTPSTPPLKQMRNDCQKGNVVHQPMITSPGSTKMIAESVPAADATVWTM